MTRVSRIILLIVVWLLGAIGFHGAGSDRMCSVAHLTKSERAVLPAIMSGLWPVVVAVRLGVAAFDPRRALAPLGCNPPVVT